jgi:nucleotide-binding universal stress UspA family protein
VHASIIYCARPVDCWDVERATTEAGTLDHALRTEVLFNAGSASKKDEPMAFQTVLCPIDFSKPSQSALRYAAALAAKEGQVIVLFVNDPLLTTAAAAAYDEDAMARTTEKEMKAFVQKALAGARVPQDRLRFVVSLGTPAVEIVKQASRLHADVIVMGTRGLGGASRLFLGSTTEQVLRKAGVPVLAVPPGARTSATRR